MQEFHQNCNGHKEQVILVFVGMLRAVHFVLNIATAIFLSQLNFRTPC